MKNLRRLFILLVMLSAVSAVSVVPADSAERTDIAHLKEIIAAADRRYEQRFDAQEKAVVSALAAQKEALSAALAASKEAVLVAETNAEKWRSNANEWRAAMTDREKNFATRAEFASIKERLDKAEGGAIGASALWGYLIGLIGLGLAGFAIVHRTTKPTAGGGK